MAQKDYSEPTPLAAKIVLIAGFSLIGLIVFFGSFYIIDAGERGVLLTFGKATDDIKQPGLHMKVPLMQKIVKMEVRTQKYEAEATAASHDLQDVHTIIAVNYKVAEGEVVPIYTTLGRGYQERLIQPAVQEVVKATTAEYTAERLITDRPLVKQDIEQSLRQRLADRGIIVETVSITDFDFSESFNAAIEAKVTAEQNALKEENNLRVVRFQADQKIEQARGDAESIRIVNEQLARSPEYTKYYLLQKWDGKMPLALGSNSLVSIASTS